MLLRIKHKVTAYHWRSNRSEVSSIAICECGWQDKMFRRLHRIILMRRITRLCWLRGCDFSEPYTIEVGPAGAPDSEFEVIGNDKQCSRCYRVVTNS